MTGDGEATDLAHVGGVDRRDVVVVLDDQRADHVPTSMRPGAPEGALPDGSGRGAAGRTTVKVVVPEQLTVIVPPARVTSRRVSAKPIPRWRRSSPDLVVKPSVKIREVSSFGTPGPLSATSIVTVRSDSATSRTSTRAGWGPAIAASIALSIRLPTIVSSMFVSTPLCGRRDSS